MKRPAFLRPRAWTRFSLRTLLLAITLVAIWLGAQMNRAQKQRAAVRALQEYGGSVLYDFEYDKLAAPPKSGSRPWEPKWLVDLVGLDFFHQVWSVNLAWAFDKDGKRSDTEKATDDVVIHLDHLPAIKSLILQGPQASDASMAHVAKLSNLEELMIITKYYQQGAQVRALRPRVMDDGIARLSGLTKLTSVYVDDAALSDRSLKTLGRMPQLESIVLQGPAGAFTDEGLRELKNLTRLRRLLFHQGYGCNEFTDAGLFHLRPLESLEELGLRGGQISGRGLKELESLGNLKLLMIASNALTPEAVVHFQEAVPGVKCRMSGYASFQEDLCKIIAHLLRVSPATIKPDGVLSEVGVTSETHAKLLQFLRNDYYQLDDDHAENLKQFLLWAADESLTVSQLADLIRQTVGR